MTCGFRNSAGTDLDSLFLTTNQNAGAVGYRQPDGMDLGNKYTHETVLGYAVGYRNSAGTDLGYLRGHEYAQPRWETTGVSQLIFKQYYEMKTGISGDDNGSEFEYMDDKVTYVVGLVAPTLANYQQSQSYTLIIDQVLWTTSGDSKGGACYGFFPEADLQTATSNILKSTAVAPEVRYEFPSHNSHDATYLTGNRHHANDLDNPLCTWRIETPFTQGQLYVFRVWWGQYWEPSRTKWQCRYLVRNNANGKDTGWFVSEIYTCAGKT